METVVYCGDAYDKDRGEKSFMDSMEKAKQLINKFCYEQYGCEADISDLSKVDLAYTVLPDDNTEVQVSVDLIHLGMNTYINGKLYSKIEYNSLEDLVKNELQMLDFDALICIRE